MLILTVCAILPGIYGVVSLDQTPFDGILLFSCSAMGALLPPGCFFGRIPTFGVMLKANKNPPLAGEIQEWKQDYS